MSSYFSNQTVVDILHIRTGPVRTGPVRTGPVRTGPVCTGPVRNGLVLPNVAIGKSNSVLINVVANVEKANVGCLVATKRQR